MTTWNHPPPYLTSYIHIPISLSIMEDPVCPSVEECQIVYEKGFRTWFSLYMHATQDSSLPPTSFQPQSAFKQQPHFLQRCLDLKHRYNSLFVSGTSTWETMSHPDLGSCRHSTSIPSFEKRVDIPISINEPTRLALSSDSDSDSRHHQSWFLRKEEDHLAVLILAWAFVLSARWTEFLSGSTTGFSTLFGYIDSQAP